VRVATGVRRLERGRGGEGKQNAGLPMRGVPGVGSFRPVGQSRARVALQQRTILVTDDPTLSQKISASIGELWSEFGNMLHPSTLTHETVDFAGCLGVDVPFCHPPPFPNRSTPRRVERGGRGFYHSPPHFALILRGFYVRGWSGGAYLYFLRKNKK